MKDFMNTPYGRDFFRNVQRISDSLDKIAEGSKSKNIHEHRIGAAQRISLAVSYLDLNMKQLDYHRTDVSGSDVYDMLYAIRTILLKSS